MKVTPKMLLLFVGALIGFLILAAIIYGIISSIFNGDDSDNKSSEETIQSNNLVIKDEVSRSTAQLLVRGPVVAREDHYQIKMTVNSGRRTIEVFEGYSQTPSRSKSYNNDNKAYEEFLKTAQRQGMFTKNASNTAKDGFCRNGEIRTYTLQSPEFESDIWATSCGEFGNLYDDTGLWRLFKDQYPDYNDIVKDIPRYKDLNKI